MPRIRIYAKWVALLVILLILLQTGLPYAFRNHRMRAYLLAHLEKSFGRRVEAQDFSMDLLPFPQMEVDGVTVGEDPAFGQEYFLRADRLTAGVRWLGFLHGHFDFGTISLSRPSLILVRNAQGRWNLEGWLPPAAQSAASAKANYGPQRGEESANHLQKIEFDDGRINFKTGDEKRPFAFTDVSGSVEQVAPGRWQLRLEAVPWRSGVALQSTGTLQVRGQVAGTSARLQPADIQVHWDKVSIADLFRMITGNDYGARGSFALDGNASIGKSDPGSPANPGSWKFAIHARAAGIHRWDLTERGDNPGLSLNLNGVWDVLAGEARANTVVLNFPHSHFEGSAALKTAGMSEWNVRVKESVIAADDVLSWYRAFQPDVAEAVSARQYFRARFALRGRPLAWEDAEISSDGGEIRIPGFANPVRIGPVQGSTSHNKFLLLPVRVSLDGLEKAPPSMAKPARAKPAVDIALQPQNQLELRYLQDFSTHNQSLAIAGRMADVAELFKTTSTLGRTLNAGWELSGGASGAFERNWNTKSAWAHWNANFLLSKAQLQAAGLNLPLQLEDIRVEWTDKGRSLNITRAEAFGANWNGAVEEVVVPLGSSPPHWGFQLHADHLDAKNLDLWFGPRARPSWLQRLLPSLLGKSDSSAKPSELLRRISAEGDFTADLLTIEKVKLVHPHAHIAFHDLHLDVKDAGAEWAGGTVRGNLSAVFSLPPQYEISAEVDQATLSQFPWGTHWADLWNGTASGRVHLTTSGIGRDALLGQLAGNGELFLKSLELRGWDVPSSLDTGTTHTGTSRWASAEGDFTIKDRSVQFDALQLNDPREKLKLSAEFRFAQALNLSFTRETASERKSKSTGPLRQFLLVGPLGSPVASVSALPSTQAKGKSE